jgi:outer membrane protein OmpA-like peptidoglycan-associated protein
MKHLLRIASVLAVATLATGCAKTIPLNMAVEVVAEPGTADVTYKGKQLGATPANVDVKTFDDLSAIMAKQGDLEVVERRVRILSPDKAQLIFRMGKGQESAVAKKLGLAKVLVFDYAEKVSFDSGKAELKQDALPILAKQAEILNQYFPNAVVNVCGHTDSTGGDDFNLKLSLDRAEQVAAFLEKQNVAKSRMKIHGFGKDYPVDSNTTPQGRGLNRRTEIVLPQ